MAHTTEGSCHVSLFALSVLVQIVIWAVLHSYVYVIRPFSGGKKGLCYLKLLYWCWSNQVIWFVIVLTIRLKGTMDQVFKCTSTVDQFQPKWAMFSWMLVSDRISSRFSFPVCWCGSFNWTFSLSGWKPMYFWYWWLVLKAALKTRAMISRL